MSERSGYPSQKSAKSRTGIAQAERAMEVSKNSMPAKDAVFRRQVCSVLATVFTSNITSAR